MKIVNELFKVEEIVIRPDFRQKLKEFKKTLLEFFKWRFIQKESKQASKPFRVLMTALDAVVRIRI